MNQKNIPIFNRYIGIDYSGAEVPKSSLKGLRIYLTEKRAGRAKKEAEGLLDGLLKAGQR